MSKWHSQHASTNERFWIWYNRRTIVFTVYFSLKCHRSQHVRLPKIIGTFGSRRRIFVVCEKRNSDCAVQNICDFYAVKNKLYPLNVINAFRYCNFFSNKTIISCINITELLPIYSYLMVQTRGHVSDAAKQNMDIIYQWDIKESMFDHFIFAISTSLIDRIDRNLVTK